MRFDSKSVPRTIAFSAIGEPWSAGYMRRISVWIRGREEGSLLLEFAITLPVLAVLMVGLLYCGLAVNNYLQLTDAVNMGGKQLAAGANSITDPCATIATTLQNAAPQLTASGFQTSAGLQFSLTLNGTAYSGSSCTAGAASLVSGKDATLQATYPFTLNIVNWYGTPTTVISANLKAQATELIQ